MRECGRCEIKPQQGPGICVRCKEPYPCERRCGHLDCQEERGVPFECVVCGKDIEQKDLFFLSRPNGWTPAHRYCVSDQVGVAHEPPTALQEGDLVRLNAEVEKVYRQSIGELADELVVEKLVDENRVKIKWLGIVPITHIQRK